MRDATQNIWRGPGEEGCFKIKCFWRALNGYAEKLGVFPTLCPIYDGLMSSLRVQGQHQASRKTLMLFSHKKNPAVILRKAALPHLSKQKKQLILCFQLLLQIFFQRVSTLATLQVYLYKMAFVINSELDVGIRNVCQKRKAFLYLFLKSMHTECLILLEILTDIKSNYQKLLSSILVLHFIF